MSSHPESPDGAAPHRPKVLLTIEETAHRLSISVRQVYRLINRNHLKVVHVGRAARIIESSLDDYVDSLTRSPFG